MPVRKPTSQAMPGSSKYVNRQALAWNHLSHRILHHATPHCILHPPFTRGTCIYTYFRLGATLPKFIKSGHDVIYARLRKQLRFRSESARRAMAKLSSAGLIPDTIEAAMVCDTVGTWLACECADHTQMQRMNLMSTSGTQLTTRYGTSHCSWAQSHCPVSCRNSDGSFRQAVHPIQHRWANPWHACARVSPRHQPSLAKIHTTTA